MSEDPHPLDVYPPPVLLPIAAGSSLDATFAHRLVEAFLSGRKATTLRSYGGDLEDFRAFVGVADVAAAAGQLLGSGMGAANELAIRYRADLITRGLAAATINRRLAALRSLVKLGRTLGMMGWTLEVEGLRSEPYRDTRGPGRAGFRKLLDQLAGRTDRKAVRDRAILRLLFDLALRRAEVVRLDVADFDQVAGVLQVLGKGRQERERLTVPGPTRAALVAWLAARGEAQTSALFTRLDRGDKPTGRLTGQAVYLVVRSLGEAAGIQARPHGLRHAGITEALDLTRGDVRAVQRFSRHKNLQTLLKYDDARQDLAGDVARRVAEGNAEREAA